MFRSEYLMHFCVRCLRDVEHVKFTYIDYETMSCTFCQQQTTVEEVKEPVLKSYRVVSISEENFNTEARRMVIVEVERKVAPDKIGEVGTSVETFLVQYPAYGKDHFTASIELHPPGKTINFIEAGAIAEQIKICMG